MNKSILFRTLAFMLIIAGVIFLFVKNTQPAKDDPWKVLPNTPAIVMETESIQQAFQSLEKNKELKNAFTEIPFFKKLEIHWEQLKSVLEKNEKFYDLFLKSKALTAVYQQDSTVNVLFILSTPESVDQDRFNRFLNSELGKPYAIIDKTLVGSSVIKVVNLDRPEHFYITLKNNLVLISKDKSLIEQALKTQNSLLASAFYEKASFSRTKNLAGKKVNSKLYFNLKAFPQLLKNVIKPAYRSDLQAMEKLACWGEADLLIKNNEMVFNGMLTGDSSSTIQKRLMEQQPQKTQVTSLMPYNTRLFVIEGFSDFSKWIKRKNIRCGMIDTKALSSLTGNEIAFVNTARYQKDFYKKSFLIIKIKDEAKAHGLFNKAAVKKGLIKYQHYTINRLKKGTFAQKLYGNLFGTIQENYYTFIDQYVILANDKDELINFLMFYETGKTLDLSKKYQAFSERFTETSNLTFYLKPGENLNVLSRYFQKDWAQIFEANSETFKNIEGLSLQLSNQAPYVYYNLFVKYSKTQHDDNLALWKVRLDSEIIKKPFPVRDHTTGNYHFIVFDKSNKVYLIRTDGTILWKKQLDGPPESEVQQVDYYKNGKIQYLFNTANKIYLIDRKGRFVKGYPVNIAPSATNGLAVFDYNRKKDYRILLAQSDKRVYNYTIKGNKVKGWKNFKMPEIVIRPIQRLVANKKDYIIVTDLAKNIKIVNRRGQQRIQLKSPFKIADHSVFYVNKTNMKGILLTTDESGKLVYISSSGKISYTDFGKFTKQHFFLYEDFNGDGSKDFIYVDQRTLHVFDRFKKELFKYRFNHPVTIKPAFFKIGKNKKVLGIVISQEKTIYLFDSKGNIIISNGLVGSIPFTVVNSKSNHEINLITGSDNVLFNYRIK